MPVVWRIARHVHALDRTGAGARDHGGRWNRRGTAAIYAGRTIAIAALEKFVNIAGIVPPDLVLVRVELPDHHSSEEPAIGDLPRDWNAVPVRPASMDYGTGWIQASRSLVLYVPSAVVVEERNAILNPHHPEFQGVTMSIERAFTFDPRLYVARTAR